MNILFLNSIDKNVYGGMEEWIRLAASGLQKNGHSVFASGREGSEFLRKIQTVNPAINVFPLRISGDFNPLTITKIKKILENNSIDIIIVNFNKDIRIGGIAARLYGKTRIVWSVGLDITSNSLVHKLLTPKLIDGVIVPSQSLKNQIIRHGYIYPDIVEVIPIGIPDTNNLNSCDKIRESVRLKYQIPADSKIAATVGRFVNQKGHTYLLEAIPEIIAQNPDIRFFWLGNGPLEQQLKDRIKQLSLDHYIVFTGMLDSVEEILLGADLMIHPSIEEPFGIAVLEGMRAGLPIIASNVGGIPEVVDNHCAVLIEPQNSKAISFAVNSLLNDINDMKIRGSHARNRFERLFSVTEMCEHIDRYLCNILLNEGSYV